MLVPSLLTALAASPDLEGPHEEAIDVMFRWENERTGEEVRGWTTLRLTWWEDDQIAEHCTSRWGRGWCGVGEFETDDGGTGVVELSVAKDRWHRLRTVSLVYDVTGATYEGDVRLERLGEAYVGVMALDGDPAWQGEWDEPIRVESEHRRGRVSRR